MIKSFKTSQELQAELTQTRSLEKEIGFVPTMGNLHQGHLSLIEASLKNHRTTIISIFVNPTQFGPHEDFDRYPRTLEQDFELLETLDQANKFLYVFTPSVDEVYPKNFTNNIRAPQLANELEGKHRPSHFDGVLTVVKRLFDLTQPTHAYFGKKDYQQLILIKDMVHKLKLPVQIQGLPIIRDELGLALSSRNQYLSDRDREQGLRLKNALHQLASMYKQTETSLKNCLEEASKLMQVDLNFNYLSFRDPKTLNPISSKQNQVMILGNYQVNQVKLLDNIEVSIK